MRSELDTALDDVVARLTAPGAMLETVPFEKYGRQLPMLKNAPPTLREVFLFARGMFGAREFLVPPLAGTLQTALLRLSAERPGRESEQGREPLRPAPKEARFSLLHAFALLLARGEIS